MNTRPADALKTIADLAIAASGTDALAALECVAIIGYALPGDECRAIAKRAHDAVLAILSAERLQMEFRGMLRSVEPPAAPAEPPASPTFPAPASAPVATITGDVVPASLSAR